SLSLSLSLFFSTYCVCNLSIYFAETRDYRMTVEMLICALDHPISNLMALAEDFKEEDAVDNIYLLHHRQQNIFLAYKQQAGSILVPKTHGGFMKVSCKL
ncbi:BnaAnng37820D, partial [Brassica napus]